MAGKQWTEPYKKTFRVALIESSFSQSERWNDAHRETILAHFERRTQSQLGNADLIVWPETATPLDAEHLQREFTELFAHASRQDTTVLVGALERTLGGDEYNSAILFGPAGRTSYRKRHLVQFAEVVPPAVLMAAPMVAQRPTFAPRRQNIGFPGWRHHRGSHYLLGNSLQS